MKKNDIKWIIMLTSNLLLILLIFLTGGIPDIEFYGSVVSREYNVGNFNSLSGYK